MRYLIGQRLAAALANGVESQEVLEQAFIDELKKLPIAQQTRDANEQHYEVPTEFYQLCLGPRLKYSSCYFATAETTLAEAENAMFALYCERAELSDGQVMLDLGCGWGSLSLYLAQRYPKSRIFALSNSRTQKAHIDAAAAKAGFTNVTVFTGDINEFDLRTATLPDGKAVPALDRVLSIEMFEHMKNYERLLARVTSWLKPEGRLFVHIFTFLHHSYHYEVNGPSDWMTKYFFAGGTMPAAGLLARFQRDAVLLRHWRVNGVHYSRTLEAWLALMDAQIVSVRAVFAKTYGVGEVERWVARWRMFFMACSELFAFNGGNEWFVSHYLFAPRAGIASGNGSTTATTSTTTTVKSK
jgi:cyclopropane-fatty-acyl-phospholipid synthase